MFLSYSVSSPLQRSTTVTCPIVSACFNLHTNTNPMFHLTNVLLTSLILASICRQTGLRAQPGPPAAVSPRQGVLAWLYPSEQQPGLSPAHQIDSVCVIIRVANANTVHLLILIHLPLVEVQAQTHMHVYVWQKHSSEGIDHILSNKAQYCKCD